MSVNTKTMVELTQSLQEIQYIYALKQEEKLVRSNFGAWHFLVEFILETVREKGNKSP